ncbi:MAG TPA: right-handed parallel beta-helix repeat-containing protein [Solirubrobacteraceae bacterium]|nr:right-handed parallel beta-helix repeat-containing protein [Solirubrobacteraceae bacterium]
MLALCAILLLAGAGSLARAAGSTLYVDGASSSCSNSGSGTVTQPFCTISAAAAVALAGNTVLVSAGTYNETVKPPRSGTAGAEIVFAAQPGATVTVRGGSYGFYLASRSYVTIDGFTVTATTSDGIVLKSSSHITVQDNDVRRAGQPVQGQTAKGIRVEASTDSSIRRNTVANNTQYGIYLLTGSTRNEISNNNIFGNAQVFARAASGMRVHGSPGNTISSNLSHDNEDSGIEFVSNSSNNLVVNNVTYRNGDHGIDDLLSPGLRVIANTVYKNVTAGINVEGGSTGATIANNISVDNGIGSPRTRGNIRVDSNSTSGTTMNHDLVDLTSSGTLLIWNTVSYTSLATFRSATGQEVAGIHADPKWSSPVNGDFHLTAGSPAIDSANSGVSGQPSTDFEGTARVDDAATANTGTGPRTYDDRGAYERVGGAVAALDHIVVSPASASIASGATQSYTAEGFDAQNNSLGDVTSSTTFTIAPDGSCSASACTATTGGSHTVTGTNAGKTATAGLSVDFVRNPGFEVGLTGWNTSGSGAGVTVTRVVDTLTGSWVAKLTNTGTTAATASLQDSPNWVAATSSGTYTAVFWVRADTAGAKIKVRFREYSGGTLVGTGSREETLTTAWQKVTLTYAVTAPGSTLDAQAYVTNAAPGTVFYADDVSILRAG